MVVVDANLLVVLAGKDSRGPSVLDCFADWIDNDIEIHAPELAPYECANALTRLIVAGVLSFNDLEDALNKIDILPIQYHQMSETKRVIDIALKLGRQNAYDASYLALAETLGCELWQSYLKPKSTRNCQSVLLINFKPRLANAMC